jgi:transcriptional regulator with XRE-family HTH domain
MEYYDLFLKKIQHERISRNISMEEMARALGISKQQWYNLEKGKTQIKMPLFFAICTFWNLSPQEFFGGILPNSYFSLAAKIFTLPEREFLIIQNLIMLLELAPNEL